MVEALALSGQPPVPSTSRTVSTSNGHILSAMVEAHFPSVWRFLRRLGVPACDVDDAAQEVLLVASRRLDTIAAGSERSFLLGTAFHVARRMNIARARHVGDSDEQLARLADETAGPEFLVSQSQERALLDAVLAKMPVDLRVVFVLYEIEEQTMQEIAGTLGLPTGTVASRLRRAREDFDARLARLKHEKHATRKP
jgi:RNA polymerase sigma-70 factor, ECF subfamily